MTHLCDTGSGLTITEIDDEFAVRAQRVDTYRIHLRDGLTEGIGELLKPLVSRLDAPRIVILADSGVRHHLPAVTAAVGNAGIPVDIATVMAGEASKSSKGLHQVWEKLHHLGATRRTLLAALGGGVTCDLVTAAAATYMRGMPYVLIPTTVVAQLDAAIGGKGGIDYQGTKNLIGAFHHPAAVFIDPAMTRTLPARHLRNGLAEAIKVALIADPDLFTTIETAADGLTASHLTVIVRAAVSAKLGLLAADPFEQADLRRLLNLGHCIGHPLEAATGYGMLHGEAVAAGIAAATAIAHRTGDCTAAMRDRILSVLAGHDLPTAIDASFGDIIWQRLDDIRRIRNGTLHLVIPQRPGRCMVHPDVDRRTFDNALSDLRTLRRSRR